MSFGSRQRFADVLRKLAFRERYRQLVQEKDRAVKTAADVVHIVRMCRNMLSVGTYNALFIRVLIPIFY